MVNNFDNNSVDERIRPTKVNTKIDDREIKPVKSRLKLPR